MRNVVFIRRVSPELGLKDRTIRTKKTQNNALARKEQASGA